MNEVLMWIICSDLAKDLFMSSVDIIPDLSPTIHSDQILKNLKFRPNTPEKINTRLGYLNYYEVKTE